jgi:hypothetical protein
MKLFGIREGIEIYAAFDKMLFVELKKKCGG